LAALVCSSIFRAVITIAKIFSDAINGKHHATVASRNRNIAQSISASRSNLVQQSRDYRLSFSKFASTRIGEGFTLLGYAARSPHLAKLLGEREAQKQQSPPVAGRDAGRNRGNSKVCRRTESPPNETPSQAEKRSVPQRVVLRRFPAFPGGLLCNQ
jgi:hypothetical protein